MRTKPTKGPNSAQRCQIAHKGAQQRTKMLKAILTGKLRLELKALKKPGTNGRRSFVSDSCTFFIYRYDVGKKKVSVECTE